MIFQLILVNNVSGGLIIALLTPIINMSITQGVFPDELNLARVIPVYKCNDKQTLSNYRPYIYIDPVF